jgi:hypothetical protein
MRRERVLKIALVLVGLLFSAGVYPLVGGLLHPSDSDTGDTMMMSLYFALGIFLLIAVRNPSEYRSLIAFAAWSCFAYAATMSIQGLEIASQRVGFLVASAVLVTGSGKAASGTSLSCGGNEACRLGKHDIGAA